MNHAAVAKQSLAVKQTLNLTHQWKLRISTDHCHYDINFINNFQHCSNLRRLLSLRIYLLITRTAALASNSNNTVHDVEYKNVMLSTFAIILTRNVTGRHRGPKRKLQAGYRALSLQRILCNALLCESCHIFDHWVWYRVLSPCYACIQGLAIILIP